MSVHQQQNACELLSPGRSAQDLPDKLIDDIESWCDPFLQVVDGIERLLSHNRVFKQRNVDIGVIGLDQAWKRGFSGVMIRGSGTAWDIRKAQPYECYSELDSTFLSGETATATIDIAFG